MVIIGEGLYRFLTLCCPYQGSFRCGECKTGFTGDQVGGCHGSRLCPNGQPNPCDVNAECVVERDGSISCVVRIWQKLTSFSACNVLHYIRVIYICCCVSVCVSAALVGQVMAIRVERTQILMHILTVSSSAETTTANRYSCLHPRPSHAFNSCWREK